MAKIYNFEQEVLRLKGPMVTVMTGTATHNLRYDDLLLAAHLGLSPDQYARIKMEEAK